MLMCSGFVQRIDGGVDRNRSKPIDAPDEQRRIRVCAENISHRKSRSSGYTTQGNIGTALHGADEAAAECCGVVLIAAVRRGYVSRLRTIR